MGLSSSKKTTKETVDRTETGSTTPTNPSWVSDAFRDFTDRIGQFGDMDPQSFVAGPSSLQQQAWNRASALGGSAGGASGGSWHPGKAIPGTGGVMAPERGGDIGTGWRAGINDASDIARGVANGPANLGSASGYFAPHLGEAQGYTAGTAHGAEIAPTVHSDASDAASTSLMDGGLDRYMSPYTQNVVDASLAGFDDNAGRVRAAQAADGARNHAFGGSRFGIREAQTEAGLGRERAMIDATLRDQGFTRATGLAEADAGRRQQANLFNAGNRTQNAQFNAGADNSRSLNQAGFDQQTNLFNTGAANDAARYGADSRNQFQLAQSQLDQNAGQFNAGQQNQMSMFNAGQMDGRQARALQAAGLMGELGNSYGANDRADIGLQADLGQQQYAIDQARRTAGLSQLQAMAQLYGASPYQLFHGQDSVGNVQGTTNTVQTSSPSMIGSALGLASMFAPQMGGLFGMGGGGGVGAKFTGNGGKY